MVSCRLSCTVFGIGLMALSLITASPLRAAAIVSVSLANTLPPNDDDSTGAISLGIGGASGINFFGNSFTDVFVNNNGNLTFGGPLSQFTPNGLATGVGLPIIAPFFADVDTRGSVSLPVMYGNAVVNGRNAFVANYINVGYFDSHDDKLNSFQAILTDRSDTGSGNFDIEFNYNQIFWETGDASQGVNGLGGISAAVGYSNGLSLTNVFFQLPGSLVNGALLDGGPNSLVGNTLGGSGVLGRYDFQVRNGTVVPPPTAIPEPISMALAGAGLIALGIFRRRLR
jgi:hypothetical protein